jgi:hypothetical protein
VASEFYMTKAAIRRLSKVDKTLGRLIARVGPCRLKPKSRRSPFEALVQSVIYQQLHGTAASAILAAEQKPKAKPYPIETCIVSGEKLGEMGSPYVFVHEKREIKLCCKGCLKDFKKDSAKYVKKLEEAEAKAKK